MCLSRLPDTTSSVMYVEVSCDGAPPDAVVPLPDSQSRRRIDSEAPSREGSDDLRRTYH